MWEEEGVQLKDESPVALVYEHHPSNIYPHWVVMPTGTYNHEYYGDMFRTKHPFSERHKWLLDNVGLGGFHASQYSNRQTWFAYESSNVAAVCFLRENDAVFFKMWWG